MNTPPNPEEGFTLISADGSEIAVTRENCALYTFIGEASMYDHVYIVGQNKGDKTATFMIFDALTPSKYSQLKQHIERNKFKQVLHESQPQDFDIHAFEVCTEIIIEREMRSLSEGE